MFLIIICILNKNKLNKNFIKKIFQKKYQKNLGRIRVNTINILKENSKSNYENLSENFCKQFISIMIKICDIEFHFKPRHNQIISLLFCLYKEKKTRYYREY